MTEQPEARVGRDGRAIAPMMKVGEQVVTPKAVLRVVAIRYDGEQGWQYEAVLNREA